MIRDLSLEYCKDHFTKIGEGSGRMVFSYDRNTVIKFAKNEAGKQQNRVESMVQNFDDVLAKVIDNHEASDWILMEKLTPLSEREFLNSIMLSKNELLLLMNYHYFKSVFYNLNILNKLKQAIRDSGSNITLFNHAFNNQRLIRVIRLMTKHGLEGGDFVTYKSWGKDIHGNLKVLDYGLSNYVWTTYYKRTVKDLIIDGKSLRITKCLVLK